MGKPRQRVIISDGSRRCPIRIRAKAGLAKFWTSGTCDHPSVLAWSGVCIKEAVRCRSRGSRASQHPLSQPNSSSPNNPVLHSHQSGPVQNQSLHFSINSATSQSSAMPPKKSAAAAPKKAAAGSPAHASYHGESLTHHNNV